MIIVQISRGIAPVASILGACTIAYANNWPYICMQDKPLIEAKNAAVAFALARQASPHEKLVLIEDDIVCPDILWYAADSLTGAGYGWARMREGKDNVMRRTDGTFLATGNCFTVVPLWCLAAILCDGPVFEAYYWHMNPDGLDLRRGNPNEKGMGSDTGFWYKVRHLPEPPSMTCLGRVIHLRHTLNDRQDHIHPCEITEW